MQQRLNETVNFTLTGLIEVHHVDLKDFFYLDGFSPKGFYTRALEQSGQIAPTPCNQYYFKANHS